MNSVNSILQACKCGEDRDFLSLNKTLAVVLLFLMPLPFAAGNPALVLELLKRLGEQSPAKLPKSLMAKATLKVEADAIPKAAP
jgi:hypothetical protein